MIDDILIGRTTLSEGIELMNRQKSDTMYEKQFYDSLNRQLAEAVIKRFIVYSRACVNSSPAKPHLIHVPHVLPQMR